MSGARARAPAAIGVFLAAAMAGAAVAVAFALHTGFDRATARADLPDVLVRFDADRRSEVDAIIRRLPNVRSRAYRFEVGDVRLAGGSDSSARGAVTFVEAHRRGYAVVSGRDVEGRPNEAVVDRGVARAWGSRSAIRSASGVSGRCGSRASPSPPTTSRSRWPPCRGSTSTSAGSSARRAARSR